MTDDDRRRILAELRKCIQRMGSLPVEEICWIVLPVSAADGAIWFEIAGGVDDVVRRFRFPTFAVSQLTGEELNRLGACVAASQWALHVHNHPELPNCITLCEPSDADLQTAAHWKAVWPESAERMKFFIVQNEEAVEYSLPDRRTSAWIHGPGHLSDRAAPPDDDRRTGETRRCRYCGTSLTFGTGQTAAYCSYCGHYRLKGRCLRN